MTGGLSLRYIEVWNVQYAATIKRIICFAGDIDDSFITNYKYAIRIDKRKLIAQKQREFDHLIVIRSKYD